VGQRVEVIFRDRVGGYRRGQVAEIEDGLFLRAALMGGKAEVVNPPDWYPGKEEEEETVYRYPGEEEVLKLEGSKDGTSHIEQSSDGKSPSPGDTKRPRRKSRESVTKDEGISSEGYGGPSEFPTSN